MMDCTLLGATQNSHAKDSVHAPQLKENRLFPLTCSVVETNNRFCFCSATLHVLCLIRSKLHDLKRQRKERLGELLQVGGANVFPVCSARCPFAPLYP